MKSLSDETLHQIQELSLRKAKELELEIVSVEWVEEHSQHILRIIADKDGGLTLEDSIALNESMSQALDETSWINEEYMLEVSSPGLERELKTDMDIKKALKEYVHVEVKEALNTKPKVKEIEGYLEEVDEDSIMIQYNQKGQIKHISIEKNNIQFIRLAIQF